MADFYEFDPDNCPGVFIGLYTHYSRFFWMIFVTGIVLTFWAYPHLGVPTFLFFLSTTTSLLFNGLTLYFYEGYLHVKARTGKSNYSVERYFLVQILGKIAVLSFIFGALLLFVERS